MLGVGIVGCGNISSIYAANLVGDVVGAADLDAARAEALAAREGFRAFASVPELLESPHVGLVLNLTPPDGHFPVNEAALRAGKHVYVEKPLSSSLADASALLDLADSKGLVVGCAPDTVLGSGIQTCRRLMDDGSLGPVTTGFASMLCPGHEAWHPDPAFYYKAGGGPLWDMGPYYLTALVWLLGPVAAVAASASTPKSERSVATGPNAGEKVPVETPTTIATTLEFVSGAVVQFLASFDVAAHDLPHIELHGQRAALRVPDPNGFGGAPMVREAGEWQPVPLDPGLTENSRGIGVREMALAIERGAPPRCSGEVALHIVEVMAGALDSVSGGMRITIASQPTRPAPFDGGGW